MLTKTKTSEYDPKSLNLQYNYIMQLGMRRSLISNSSSIGDINTVTPSLLKNISLTEVRHIPNLIKNACKPQKCRYWPNLDRSGKITCTITGTIYNCKRNCTCKSSNLVYAISCITCKQQYVGQTKRMILEHSQEGHYANISKATRHPGKNPQDDPRAHPWQHHRTTFCPTNPQGHKEVML